jgi:hypothetical protein
MVDDTSSISRLLKAFSTCIHNTMRYTPRSGVESTGGMIKSRWNNCFYVLCVDQNKLIMRILSTKAHGILDYLMGAILIASPWLFDFARNEAETWVPVILGVGMIIYSLFTDYELGAYRKLSMKNHLTLDLVGGAVLAASPWLFNFDEYVYLPHLILGILEIGAALITEMSPSQVVDRSARTEPMEDKSFTDGSRGHAH